MKKRTLVMIILAVGVMAVAGCAKQTGETTDAGISVSQAAATEKKVPEASEQATEPDGTLIDYEEKGVLTLGKYKGVEVSKKELKDETMSEEEMKAEIAWGKVVDATDVEEVQQGLIDEEYGNIKVQYEGMAELLGTTYEDTLAQFGMDDDTLKDLARDQVILRMIAKTIMVKEGLELKDKDYVKYLKKYMEDDSDDTNKEQLEEEYNQDYGNRPKDDMCIELVRDYVGSKAVVSGK